MKKVLICDDDIGILEVIRIMLEENEYKVKTIDNGRSIQKIINDFEPDVLLLDIWMPGIDGKEITKLLKREKETQNLPIIVISALNDTEKIAQNVGADDSLSKPFSMQELLDKVKKHAAKS